MAQRRLGAPTARLFATMMVAGCVGGVGDAGEGALPDDVPDQCASVPFTQVLSTPPVRSVASPMPIDLDLVGQGYSGVGSISVARDRGTVVVNGRKINILVYSPQQYPGTTIVYQAFGYPESADELYLIYFYCDAGSLTKIFYESTIHPGTGEATSGTCADRGMGFNYIVDLPALNIRVPRLSCNFSVSTPADALYGILNLPGNGPGTITDQFERVRMAIPFTLYDCTTGNCDGGLVDQTFEMHLLLWDPSDGPDLEVGVLYFPTSAGIRNGTGAFMINGFNLSPYGMPTNYTQYMSASWTFY